MIRRILASLLFLFSVPNVWAIDPPTLVADINAVGRDGYTRPIVQSGTNLFFVFDDDTHGRELWVSDGVSGASLLLDIYPGTTGSSPLQLTSAVINGTPYLFFFADDGVNGRELWKTDGTAGGTTLVMDINPGSGGSDVYGYSTIQAVMNGVAFTADDGVNGAELWLSRGTAGTTSLIFDIRPGPLGSLPRNFVYRNNLFFTADNGTNGEEMWASNLGGVTVLLNDFYPGANASSITEMKIFFNGVTNVILADPTDGTNGAEPYYSVGFINDKTLIKDIQPGAVPSFPGQFTYLSPTYFFRAFTYANGYELYSSNLTGAGTNLLIDLDPGTGSSYPDNLVVSGGVLYFTARTTGAGIQVWTSDGTLSGTKILKQAAQLQAADPGKLYDFSGTLLFSYDDGGTGSELWKSNGDPFATPRVADINPGAPGSYPSDFVTMGSKAYFAAYSPGRALWQTDGTTAGTSKVADLTIPGSSGSSVPSFFSSAGQTLYLGANDGIHGYELWKSDGTASGTALVKDIANGSLNSNPYILGAVNGKLLFTASGILGDKLWITDGTDSGTDLLKNLNPGGTDDLVRAFAKLGDTVGVFAGSSDGTTFEIWRTDATPAGTQSIFGPASGFLPRNLTAVGSKAYFISGYVAPELWTTDGTTGGTQMVANGFVGVTPYFNQIFDFNGTPVFMASDGTTGQELWKSDGTPGNKTLVKDINPGAADSSPEDFAILGSRLFFEAKTAAEGGELWVSDGTDAGTMLVKDINPGVVGSGISGIVGLGSKVLFGAADGTNGGELWASDGTDAGTALLKDICPGSCASGPSRFVVAGEYVFFQATDDTNGSELWITDGTPEGTVLFADIYSGSGSSFPASFKLIGQTLYFAAQHPASQTELWKLVLPDAPDDPDAPTTNEQAKSQLDEVIALVKGLKYPKTKAQKTKFRSDVALIKLKSASTYDFLNLHLAELQLTPNTDLPKLIKKAKPAVKKSLSKKNNKAVFGKLRKKALKALDALKKSIV